MTGSRDAITALFDLTGRRALVTGASQGLGFQIAAGLARAGATVVLNGRDGQRLAAPVDTLRREGLDVHPGIFDVGDREAAAHGLEQIRSDHGDLDILVSNVGRRLRKPIDEVDPASFDALFAVNVSATYALAHALAGPMADSGWGRLIFISSTAARFASPVTTAYGASKAALESLARSFAVAYARSGVTANALAPGGFATERNAQSVAARPSPARAPIGRWGRPEEIVGAALFLASPAGSYVNGHVLTVDGGLAAAT